MTKHTPEHPFALSKTHRDTARISERFFAEEISGYEFLSSDRQSRLRTRLAVSEFNWVKVVFYAFLNYPEFSESENRALVNHVHNI